jgi:TolA-binding protein
MIMVESETDQPVAELITLARTRLGGDSVLSEDALFARLEERMAARPKPVISRGFLGGLGALGATSALVAALLLLQNQAITFQVADGAVSQDGRIVGAAATRIRFSDGSEAVLSRGTEAQVQQLTEHGAQVVLQRGSMRMQIAKKPEAAWTVAAGPYDVRVTGTAFDVSWSAQTQALDLRLQSGAVIVTGPLAGSGIVLKAGQRLFGGVAEGRLTVESADATGQKAPPPLASLSPQAETEVKPAPALDSSSGVAASRASDTQAWSKQVAQGRFAAVLEEAERRGLSRTLASASLEELAALAEAARYAGRGGIAKRALLAGRQRFPGSAPARDAAFFLGRIAEGSGEGGIDWYERYLNESPGGPYASQALGRKMMLVYRQRGAGTAKPIATDYLSRFPNGPYAAAARKLEQEAAPAPKP